MILVKNISKTYNNKKVIDKINLVINKGEIVSIIGPSGAGKTTLLNLISTLDSPDKNNDSIIKINDIDVLNLNDTNLSKFRNTQIGFIFQFHNLISELNVVENVTIPTLIAGKKIDEAYVNELFDYFDLSNRKKSFPLDLSGGEKQRISAMRAIINKPSIVIADEPTGNLDEHNAIKMIELFQKLNHDFNLTFVIATHDKKVFNIGDKKMNLYDGILL